MTILLLALPSSAFARRCINQHPHTHEGEGFNFLSNRNFTCKAASSKRMEELRGFLPSGMFQISSSEEQVVMSQFATIPNSHIETLVAYYKNGTFSGGVKTGNPGGGAAGVTQLRTGMGARGFLPTYIVLAPGMAAFAFLHEVGHALEDTLVADIQKKGGDLDGAIDRLYSEVRSSSRARSYAKTSKQEAFAEMYANFYCNEDSRREINEILSKETVAFLDKYFEKPYWITENQKPAPEPNPTNPGASQDILDKTSNASQAAQASQVERVPDAGLPVKIALHDSGHSTYLYVASTSQADSAYICSASSQCQELGIEQEYSGKTFFSGYDVSSLIGKSVSVQVNIAGKAVVRNIFLQRRQGQ